MCEFFWYFGWNFLMKTHKERRGIRYKGDVLKLNMPIRWIIYILCLFSINIIILRQSSKFFILLHEPWDHVRIHQRLIAPVATRHFFFQLTLVFILMFLSTCIQWVSPQKYLNIFHTEIELSIGGIYLFPKPLMHNLNLCRWHWLDNV